MKNVCFIDFLVGLSHRKMNQKSFELDIQNTFYWRFHDS